MKKLFARRKKIKQKCYSIRILHYSSAASPAGPPLFTKRAGCLPTTTILKFSFSIMRFFNCWQVTSSLQSKAQKPEEKVAKVVDIFDGERKVKYDNGNKALTAFFYEPLAKLDNQNKAKERPNQITELKPRFFSRLKKHISEPCFSFQCGSEWTKTGRTKWLIYFRKFLLLFKLIKGRQFAIYLSIS